MPSHSSTRAPSGLSRRDALRLSAGAATVAAASRATAAPPSGDATLDTQIADIVQDAMRRAAFPGLVVAVERAGSVIHRRGYGLADIENQVAASADAIFPIGSVTKTVTGLAIAQLQAAGKVRLDDAVDDHLSGMPPAMAALKVRHLLTHTSGLVSYTDIPDFPADSQKPFTRGEMVGWFANRPLQFEPGSRYNYTNSGFYLLGLIIEKVSGLSYEAYLHRHVFEPFGMANSSLAGWQEILPRRAHGYRASAGGLRNAPRYDPLVPFAAGAVLSTADDLLAYRRGVFGAGPTTPEVRRLLLEQQTLSSGRPVPYALGALAISPFEGHRKIMHPGAIFGFSSQYAYYPDDDVTIVVLTNMQTEALPPVSIEQKIARAVLGLTQPRIVDVPLAAAEAAAFAGAYEVGEIRFAVDRLTFVYRDGALGVAFGEATQGPLLPLRYQGRGAFVSAVDDEHGFRFKTSGGRRTMAMSYYGSVFEAQAAQ